MRTTDLIKFKIKIKIEIEMKKIILSLFYRNIMKLKYWRTVTGSHKTKINLLMVGFSLYYTLYIN